MSVPFPLHFHPLHGASVSFPRSANRGDLRSVGINHFLATPLRLTGPHHSRRGHPSPSFYIGRGTRVLPLRLIPQELLVRRSPGYLPAVVSRLAGTVLDPGGAASRLSLSRPPLGLRLIGQDRPTPDRFGSRGYVSDSGLHPSPRCSHLSDFPAYAFRHYVTERLTRPYSGGLVHFALPLSRQPLPGCPIFHNSIIQDIDNFLSI